MDRTGGGGKGRERLLPPHTHTNRTREQRRQTTSFSLSIRQTDLFVLTYVYVVFMYDMCAWVPEERRRKCQIFSAGAIASCEPPSVDAGNQALVLCQEQPVLLTTELCLDIIIYSF